MRDYELELIASLAERTLDDETEALALVESSAEHRAEYEAQKLALRHLGAIGPVTMTDTEKTAMHRDLWTDLRTTPSTTGIPWYYRWVPVAAGLLVVVGVVSVLSNQSANDSSGERAGATVVAADDGGGDETVQEETAQGDDGAADEEPTSGGYAASPPVAETDEATALEFSNAAEKVRQGEYPALARSALQSDSASDETQVCLGDAGLEGYRELGEIPNPAPTSEFASNTLIVAIPVDGTLTDGPLAFVEPDTCTVVHFEG